MQIQQQQSIEGPLIFASASLQFPDVLTAVRSTIRDEVMVCVCVCVCV